MNEPFNDITPPEGLLQEPEPGGRLAVAGFRDTLYLAELVHDEVRSRDRCRVLGYDFDQGRWDTLASLEVYREGEVPSAVAPAVRFLALREPGAAEETLFLRFVSPLGVQLLCLGEGGEFGPRADASPLIENSFGFNGLVEIDGQLFGRAQDEAALGRVAGCRPECGVWQLTDLPDFPGGGRRVVSLIAAFAGVLYATTVDGERGLELWRSEGVSNAADWKLVFERGAWRYAQNRETFAMVGHAGGLYLVLGTGETGREPRSKFLDYQGFEVLRVAGDGTWDLLVGTPRFSPIGLLVPLSGLGPGMHPRLRLEYRTCSSHDGRLLLGLYGINGFQLWASMDGEVWGSLVHPELAAIHQVNDGCRAIPLGGRLALVLETTDALGNQATRIWAGCPSASYRAG